MKKILFRIIRNDMTLLMRKHRFTWSKINQVLEAFGQKVVTTVEYRTNGVMITYERRTAAGTITKNMV